MNNHLNIGNAAADLVLKDLSIGYRSRNTCKVVAGHIDGEIRRGEMVCLLGANGVGKSTLMKTICAFLPGLSGEILLSGRPVSSYAADDLARVFSVVLTDRCDVLNMSVYDMAGMGRTPYTNFLGQLRVADREAVERALAQVGISHLAGRMMHSLSDGERQKVMIAKSLAQDTPFIFLDEPTAFLDYPSKVDILRLLHNLSRTADKAIFLSTHDVELAMQVADRLWLMGGGDGMVVGTPEDLARQGFIGRIFACPGLEFDACRGSFHVKMDCSRQVSVDGDESLLEPLRRALMRNGIEAVAGGNLDVRITADTGRGYLLHLPGQPGVQPVAAPDMQSLLSILTEHSIIIRHALPPLTYGR